MVTIELLLSIIAGLLSIILVTGAYFGREFLEAFKDLTGRVDHLEKAHIKEHPEQTFHFLGGH